MNHLQTEVGEPISIEQLILREYRVTSVEDQRAAHLANLMIDQEIQVPESSYRIYHILETQGGLRSKV